MHWFLGLLVGGLAGLAPLGLGTLGLLLAIPVVLWTLTDRPRGVALGGALVGVGVAWFVGWGRAMQACVGPNTATDGCVGPDLSGLQAVPIVLLAVGGLISFVTAMRMSPGRPTASDDPESSDEER
jgi:hypothetical protein